MDVLGDKHIVELYIVNSIVELFPRILSSRGHHNH